MLATLPPNRKGSLLVRRMRAEIQVRLGEAVLRQGKPKEAEKHFVAALNERKELVRLTPRPPAFNALVKTDLAQSQMLFGDYYLMGLKDATAAMHEYEAALQIYEQLLRNDQDNLEFQRGVATIEYRLGYVADKQIGVTALAGTAGPVAESRRYFGKALELSQKLADIDAKDTQGQISLMLTKARLGQIAEAEKIAGQLLKQAGDNRETLFQVACGLSIAGTGTGDVAKHAKSEHLRSSSK